MFLLPHALSLAAPERYLQVPPPGLGQPPQRMWSSVRVSFLCLHEPLGASSPYTPYGPHTFCSGPSRWSPPLHTEHAARTFPNCCCPHVDVGGSLTLSTAVRADGLHLLDHSRGQLSNHDSHTSSSACHALLHRTCLTSLTTWQNHKASVWLGPVKYCGHLWLQ